MNPLNNYPRIRSLLYLLQWAVTGVQTVLSAYFAFEFGNEVDAWPEWFLASLAVAPVLWTYLGLTARNNVTDDTNLPTHTIHGGTGDSGPS